MTVHNYSDWIKQLKLEWSLNALQRVKQKSCESFRVSYKSVFNVLCWWNLSSWFQWISLIYLIFFEVEIPLSFQFHCSLLFLNCVSTSHIYITLTNNFSLENGRYVLFSTLVFYFCSSSLLYWVIIEKLLRMPNSSCLLKYFKLSLWIRCICDVNFYTFTNNVVK